MMNTDSNKNIAMLCVFCAGLLWGCMGILVRNLNAIGLKAMDVVTFRSVVTAVIMLCGMLLFNRKGLRVRLRDLWCFAGTGILSVTFFNVCYFTCMNYTSLSTAAILLYTAPSFVIVMSFFLFKEKFTGKKVAALFLAFAGCVLVSGGFTGNGIGMMGILTGLGAGFGYALYSIFSRYAIQRGYSSLTITTYTFIFAAAGALPFINVGSVTQIVIQNPQTSFYGVALTFLTTVAAYLLYTRGLSGIENGKASIIASVEPVMASIVGMVVFQETMQPMGIVGMLLVLASTLICYF